MEDNKSKEIRLITENHFLSLRKKIKNKENYDKKICLLNNIFINENINKINLDIKGIESKINNHKQYIKF